MTRAEKLEEMEKTKNPEYMKQQAKKLSQARSKRTQVVSQHKAERCEHTCDTCPEINLPEFLDYQDFVSPVFRIDLYLPKDEGNQFSNPDIKFSHSDEEIMSGFSTLIENTICAFNDFCRPEFYKVTETE